ncbi:MAG TPA: efflux RND transporter permease subunit [Candidatus Dojkabacteria bacterium]|jgi:multidrug efflux pump subunit AcrB
MKDTAITKFSLFFSNKIRVTILLILGISVLGIISYTSLLKREGIPPINTPYGFINIRLQEENPILVDENVVSPIIEAISDIEDVKSVTTNSYPFGSTIAVTFDSEVTSKEGVTQLENEIDRNVEVPENVAITYQILDAGKISNEYDLAFTLTKDNVGLSELQTTGEKAVEKLITNEDIVEAKVIDIFDTIEDDFGGSIRVQQSYNRVGIRTDGELVFNEAVFIGLVRKDEDQGIIEFEESVVSSLESMQNEEGGILNGYDVVFENGNTAEYLRGQFNSLESNAFQALVIVIVVLFLLVSWRGSIISALFIPLVFTGTFLGLFLIGYSLNVMTLFALILVLGLVVDDAIVVVEAIDYEKRNGAKGLTAIKNAINRMGIADVSGTLTTLLVFIPLAAVSGILGEFIRIIPITVITALIVSLTIGLSIIPFLSNAIIPDAKQSAKLEGFKRIIDILVNGFNRQVTRAGEMIGNFVGFYLKRPIGVIVVIIISFILIGAGMFSSAYLKQNNFPAPKDSDQIAVVFTYGGVSDPIRAEELSKQGEEILKKYSEYVTSAEYAFFFSRDNPSATMYLVLTPMTERDKTSVAISEAMNQEFAQITDLNIKASPVSVGPPEDEYPFKVQVFAENAGELEEKANLVASELSTIVITENVVEELGVEDVIVNNLQIVSRLDGRRYAQVAAKLSGGSATQDLNLIRNDLKKIFDSNKLNELGWSEDTIGYDLGQEDEFSDSFQGAIVAMGFALLLMYGLLVLQFNSFLQPLLIFVAIPFSFVGLFPGLLATDNDLSFFVLIGITGLLGIVVNNTIMLLDYANQVRAEGKVSYTEAMKQAVKVRFRPLLTTSVTTIAGLVPLALSDPFWESIAYSIIFGLFASTTMVIFVFPAYYAAVEFLRNRVFHKLFPALKEK